MRPVPDVRALKGAAVTLSYQWRDTDGEPAAPLGTVTVGIVDAAGTTVVAAGTATGGAGSNPRTYAVAGTLTTQTALWTVTWTDSGSTAVTTLVEVVGGYYFTVAEFTAWLNPAASDWSSVQVVAARRAAEESCEALTGVTWVPRYSRERFAGSGTSCQWLPHPMLRTVRSGRTYSDATTYTAFTAPELAAIGTGGEDARAGIAVRTDGTVWTSGYDNIVLEYEHGFDRPPRDLQLAVMKHCRSLLIDSTAPMSSMAERFTTGDGVVISRAIPTSDRLGLPDVDAVYARYSMMTPGLA